MLFRQLFDPESSTYTYLLADEASKEAVIIDPVKSQVDRDCGLLRELGLTLKYAIDTHVHADHVTGAGSLRERTGAKTVVSKRAGVACADVAVDDGDSLRFGTQALQVLATPGHTHGCLSFFAPEEKMVFTGDALLIRGTGRTDFQQGNASTLFHSIRDKLFALPGDTKVFPGHDYRGEEMSTIEEEQRLNPRAALDRSKEDFLGILANLRLPPPKKIDEAVPLNLLCGLDPQAQKPHRPFGDAPIERNVAGISEIDAESLEPLVGTVRIIDVREPGEFWGELSHIPGAELFPLGKLLNSSAALDKGQPLVVVCRSGGRSGQGAKLLEGQGFKNVVSLRGGMMRWNQLGYVRQEQAA